MSVELLRESKESILKLVEKLGETLSCIEHAVNMWERGSKHTSIYEIHHACKFGKEVIDHSIAMQSKMTEWKGVARKRRFGSEQGQK